MPDSRAERNRRLLGSVPSSIPAGGAKPALFSSLRSGGSYQNRVSKYRVGGDKGDDKPRGLFEQFTDTAFALPEGLVNLGGQLLDSTSGNLAAGVNLALGNSAEDVRGGKGIFGILNRAATNERLLDVTEKGGSFGDIVRASQPLGTEVYRSGSGTIGRVTNLGAALAPGGLAAGDSDYAKAVDEGNILPVLLEDVGNAVIAGKVVSRGVAGASRASAAAAAGAPKATVARNLLRGERAGQKLFTRNPSGVEVFEPRGPVGRLATRADRAFTGVDDAMGRAMLSPVRGIGRIPTLGAKYVTGEGSRLNFPARIRTGTGIGEVAAQSPTFMNWLDKSRTGKVLESLQLGRGFRQFHDIEADAHLRKGEIQEMVAEAFRHETDSIPEQIAARVHAAGMVDAMGLGQLNPATRHAAVNKVVDTGILDEARAMLGGSADDVVAGFELAARYADGDLDAATRARIDRTEAAWRQVDEAFKTRLQEGYGRPDHDPATAAMLTGDDLLPYNRMREAASIEAERVRLTKNLGRQDKKVARMQEGLRAPDAMFDGASPRRVSKEWEARSKAHRAVARNWVAEQGSVRDAAEIMFDVDADGNLPQRFESLSDKQLEKAVLDHLQGEINTSLTSGSALPPWLDVDTSGLEALPDRVLSDVGAQGMRRDQAREGVVEQAEVDAATLRARESRIAERSAEMAARMDTRIRTEGKASGGASAAMAAGRTTVGPDQRVAKAAKAVARAQEGMRRAELSDKGLGELAKEIREGLLPAIENQVETIEGQLESYYEGPVKLTYTGNVSSLNDYTTAFLDEAGISAKQAHGLKLGAKSTRRLHSSDGMGWDQLHKSMEDSGRIPENASIDDAVSAYAEDVSKWREAKQAARVVSGKEKGVTIGDVQAGFWDDMLREYVDAMDDPEMADAVFGPDPTDGMRELQNTRMVADWVTVADEAAAEVLRMFRDADVDDPRTAQLAPEEITAVRDRWAEREGTSPVEVRLRKREFDAAHKEWQKEIADLNAGRRAGEAVGKSKRESAKRGATAGRQLGRTEGELSELRRQASNAESRSKSTTDAYESEQNFLARNQARAYREGAEEGRRRSVLAPELDKLRRLEADLAELDATAADRLDAAIKDVTSAPGRQRIAIEVGKAMDSVYGDLLAEASDDVSRDMLLRAKGEVIVDAVEGTKRLSDAMHLPGSRVQRVGSGGRPPVVRRLDEQHLKEGVVPALDSISQATILMRRAEQQARNAMSLGVLEHFGRRATDFLDEDTIEAGGLDLVRAVNEAAGGTEYVPVNPKSPHISADQIDMDTIFVPRYIRDALADSFKETSGWEKIAQWAIDNPTRFWKHAVLALRPAWHLGNMVGNVLMAWAGGVPPHRQLMLARSAHRALKSGELPFEVHSTGPTADARMTHRVLEDYAEGPLTAENRLSKADLRLMQARDNRLQKRMIGDVDRSKGVGRVRDKLAHPIRSSYDLNQWVDDMTHSIVYLDRMQKGASPDVAIRDALKVAGNFNRMTKLERRVIRRAMPFYAWMRHITMLSADLAVNHPLRTIWTMHLWTMFADEDQDRFSDVPGMFGALPYGNEGDEFLKLGNLMPFGTVLEMDPSDPAGTLAGSINPFAKLGLYAGTGIEVGPGGLGEGSAPYGAKPAGMFGSEGVFNPLSELIGGDRDRGARAIFEQTVNMFPQAKLFRDLNRPRLARYDTGDPVHGIPKEDLQSTQQAIFRDLLGVPLPRRFDPIAERREREAARRQRAQSLARYEAGR